jgi:phospholipase/carboxylesterase
VENLLDCVEINPKATPIASVIWLHGLGADGYDFVTIIPELNLPNDLPIRFVFPNAPLRPVTLNAGYTMRAWFDIYGLQANSRIDEIGIREMQSKIDALVAREIKRGIVSEHIVLAGFSQGGAMALHCGLRYPKKLAGIMGLSAFLLMPEKIVMERRINDPINIFLAHGTYDQVIPIQFGEMSKNALLTLGYHVEWRTYPMAHEVCLEEIHDIGAWLVKRLSRI